MFELLERNESLVELSLANTGMTDTAAAVLARALGRMQLLLLCRGYILTQGLPISRLQFYTFFGISIGIKRKMKDIGKKK